MMSGTSLDGLDLALCRFWKDEQRFHYEIVKTQTFSYSQELVRALRALYTADALHFCRTEVAFSNFMAQCVNQFLEETTTQPDFIASHGHTVFHQPENGLTKQIGNGAILAAKTGISTICDFRTTDIALGGQGAPLVPIGDALLFPEYAGCLNLGGISNISKYHHEKLTAYDISLCNIMLNYLAMQKGLPYDSEGALAQQGKIAYPLLEAMNQPDFFSLSSAKSIGFEFFTHYYQPLLENSPLAVEDKLRTACEHIAIQIASHIKELQHILATGGGAKNNFLMRLLKEKTKAQIFIPDTQLIDFKEAIIFAFLGYLRIHETNNCLHSVTGASRNSCGGAIYTAHC
jgi:anhydro-N-acetylmuramic acid kinase